MEKITGGQAVVKALTFLNVEKVFGIPGVHNLSIYSALSDSALDHVSVRHEQSAGFMADGYARTTGKVGVALTISGPGLTNILTAMGEAFHEAIPMLVISTNLPTKYLGGRVGLLHELSQSNTMVRSVAKESRRVPNSEAIIPYIIEAYYLAITGRPGPVHIEIPLDLLDNRIIGCSTESMNEMATLFKPSAPIKSGEIIERAREIIEDAEHPLLFLGGGAWQAADKLRQMAEMLAAPVLLTPAAKGIIDDNHPLCLGVRHQFPAVQELLKNVDVVIAAGTELAEDGWGNFFSTNGKLIQIDIDAASFERNQRANLCLEGDANIITDLINKRIKKRNKKIKDAHLKVKNIKEKASQEIALISEYKDLDHILNVLNEIRASLPQHAILSADSTRPAYIALSEYPSHSPRSFLFPCGYGTLGMALPAAIGAKLAHPNKPVCVLSGDGGFQFTMPELGTACQEKLNIPIIIYNDHGYGEIRLYEEKRHLKQTIAVDLKNPEFEYISKAYNIPFFKISEIGDLNKAITNSLMLQGPSIIEINLPK